MLSSRNRRLKRLSRLLAFFVIVFAGCYYQCEKLYSAFAEYTSTDEFIEESPLVPPFLKNLHRQKRRMLADAKRHVTGANRLPPQDEHELLYRDRYLQRVKGGQRVVQESDLERGLGMIRTKNPYTQALKRQAFFKVSFLRFIIK